MLAPLLLVHMLLGACEENDPKVVQRVELVRPPSEVEMVGIHELMDVDGDKDVTLDEGFAYAKKHGLNMTISQSLPTLKVFDTGKDGMLSQTEFMTGFESMVSDPKALRVIFPLCDDNADKALDPKEFATFFSWMSKSAMDLDVDGNFKISNIEFNSITDGRLKEQGATEKVRKQHKKHGDSIFQQLDVDQDGQLSPKEFFMWESGAYAGQEAWRKLVELADKDYDEAITAAELIQVSDKEEFLGTNAYFYIRDWMKNEGLIEAWREEEAAKQAAEDENNGVEAPQQGVVTQNVFGGSSKKVEL